MQRLARRIFWLTTMLILAMAVHLGVVIFTPRAEMSRIMRQVKSLAGENSLQLLTSEEAARLLNETTPGLRIAICVIDVKKAPVVIHAVIPERDWSINLYASDGTSIYALNGRQAAAGPIAITIHQHERTSLFDAAAAPEAPAAPNKFTVETTRPTGLAVIRTRLPSPAYAARADEEFKQSSCRVAPDQPS